MGAKTFKHMITVSTASAYKFASDVCESITGNAPAGDLEALEELSSHTGVRIPKPLSDIGERRVLHESVIDKTDMERTTLDFASTL